jgi:hypothetical protein
MNGLIKDNFVYLITAKNGSTTYGNFLAKHGWQYKMLSSDELGINLKEYKLWGHLTDPFERHTKGIVEFLRDKPDLDLDNPNIAKLLVSGIYDCHTYTVTMIYSPIMHLDITWIPLDYKITNYLKYPHVEMDGDDLTNDFFKDNNLDLKISKQDHRWRLTNNPEEKQKRAKIKKLKEIYAKEFLDFSGNILEHDIILYNSTVEKTRKKYGSEV